MRYIYLFLLIGFTVSGFSQRIIQSKPVKLLIPPKFSKADTVQVYQNIEENNQTEAFESLAEKIQKQIASKNVSIDIQTDSLIIDDFPYLLYSFGFKAAGNESDAKSDFPSGEYLLDSSRISAFLTNSVGLVLEELVLNHLEAEDQLIVKISGSADATDIRGIKYKSEFGRKLQGKYLYNSVENEALISDRKLIKKNQELAFLRTYGIRFYLEQKYLFINEYNVEFEHVVEIFGDVGFDYRKVSIDLCILRKL